jgi:ABC-type transporter Mla subunit MlaD
MTTPTQNSALEDVAQAYDQRRALAERLKKQDTYIGELVRQARAGGATWAQIAAEARTSDVAVLKASHRMPEESQKAG